MAQSFPDVSVVIPTFNRRKEVRKVLEPLLSDDSATEVIVVVDGSVDGTIDMLDTMAVHEPRLKPVWVENGGEMRARAEGASRASGDVVLFLDDDVLAEHGLPRYHAERHAAQRGAVVVGYMPVHPDFLSDAVARLYAREYEGRVATYGDGPDTVLRHLWAGNFSMRRVDCESIGMADTSYRARYHPDREFGLRCLRHGLTGIFAPEARALHLYSRSLPSFIRDARSQGEARVLLHEMHGELLGAMPADSFEAGLPAPLLPLLRLAGRRPIDNSALRTLTAVAGCCRRSGHVGAETAVLRLLRRVAQLQGARAAITADSPEAGVASGRVGSFD